MYIYIYHIYIYISRGLVDSSRNLDPFSSFPQLFCVRSRDRLTFKDEYENEGLADSVDMDVDLSGVFDQGSKFPGYTCHSCAKLFWTPMISRLHSPMQVLYV